MELPGTWSWPSPLVAFSAVSALLLLAMNAHLWWRRPPPALSPALPCVMAGGLLFAVGDAASFFAKDAVADWLSLLVIYGGLVLAVPAYPILAARFAELQGRPLPWGRSPWLRLGAAWGAGFWLVLLTNPWHGLFVTPVVGGQSERHLLWYLYTASAYAMVVTACVSFLMLAVRPGGPGVARSQGRLMAAAAIAPLLANVVYLLGPPLPFDPTMVGLCASCGLLLLGAWRHVLRVEALPPRELLRAQSDPVLLVDVQGRLLHHNPAAEGLLATGPEIGEPVFPAFARAIAQRELPEQPLSASGLAADLLSPEQPAGGHLLRLREGGRWMRVEVSALRSEDGDLVGHCLRLRDETTLHHLMEAVDEQLEMLETVIAATDEGVLVHVGSEIRLTNPQFDALWGLPEELRGAADGPGLVAWLGDRVVDRERFEAATAQVWRNPARTLHDEVALRDGRILERTSLPLRRGDLTIGRVWRVRDVTDQRRSQEAMRVAQKLESLAVMAGGVAHDFNNLLATVLGNAGLARDAIPAGSAAGVHLAGIERAASRASRLTGQLLDYAGSEQIETEALDVSSVVRDAVDLVRVSMGAAELRCDLAAELPAVIGDASQLGQVVMNLVLNAADAVGEGRGVVSVSTRLESLGAEEGDGLLGSAPWRPGRYVALRVADDGCGIDVAHRERIFDPFFTTKSSGRGLGLAATVGIVRSHGAYLRVESEPGRGSVFTVLIPASEATVASPVGAATPPAPAELAGTVLVVDDDADVAQVAAEMLRSVGLRVLVAHDGEGAVKSYLEAASAIDAVLLDLGLPGMGGAETARELRRADPDVRIVASSGYPEGGLEGEQVRDFVQKPYSRATLVAAIRGALV